MNLPTCKLQPVNAYMNGTRNSFKKIFGCISIVKYIFWYMFFTLVNWWNAFMRHLSWYALFVNLKVKKISGQKISYLVADKKDRFQLLLTSPLLNKSKVSLRWQTNRNVRCNWKMSNTTKKQVIIGQMAFRWHANDSRLGSFWFFRGSGPVLLRNPIFLWFFRRGGRGSQDPPPSGSSHDCYGHIGKTFKKYDRQSIKSIKNL